MLKSSITPVYQSIERDFSSRLAGYHKSRREGLCMLAALMLDVRSANLMELSAALPRKIAHADERYRYIERLLSNPHIDIDAVSGAYIADVFERLAADGQTAVLMLDQSHINDHNDVLMVSVRIGRRALPVAWRVKQTRGVIGFDVQKDVLDAAYAMVPDGVSVMLAADRFYSTPALIQWCQKAGWSYRIRLKSNLSLHHQGGELVTGDLPKTMPQGVTSADLCGSGVITNIGVLHEKGHKEPWIIAMDCKPSQYTTLDYGFRWGIEAMFSDFKSRGFGLMQSQIKKPDRLEKLILIMAIAMHHAVSCGMFETHKTADHRIKKGFVN